jgi:hypothetical protein
LLALTPPLTNGPSICMTASTTSDVVRGRMCSPVATALRRRNLVVASWYVNDVWWAAFPQGRGGAGPRADARMRIILPQGPRLRYRAEGATRD